MLEAAGVRVGLGVRGEGGGDATGVQDAGGSAPTRAHSRRHVFGSSLGLPTPSTHAQRGGAPWAGLSAVIDACAAEEEHAAAAAVPAPAVPAVSSLLDVSPLFLGGGVSGTLDVPIGIAYRQVCPLVACNDVTISNGFEVTGSMEQLLRAQDVQRANFKERSATLRMPVEVGFETTFSVHVSAPVLRTRSAEAASLTASTLLRPFVHAFAVGVEGDAAAATLHGSGEGGPADDDSDVAVSPGLLQRVVDGGLGGGEDPPHPPDRSGDASLARRQHPSPLPSMGEVALQTEAQYVLRPVLGDGGVSGSAAVTTRHARAGGNGQNSAVHDAIARAVETLGPDGVLTRVAKALHVLAEAGGYGDDAQGGPVAHTGVMLEWRQHLLPHLSSAVKAASADFRGKLAAGAATHAIFALQVEAMTGALEGSVARAESAETKAAELEEEVLRMQYKLQGAERALALHRLSGGTAGGGSVQVQGVRSTSAGRPVVRLRRRRSESVGEEGGGVAAPVVVHQAVVGAGQLRTPALVAGLFAALLLLLCYLYLPRPPLQELWRQRG